MQILVTISECFDLNKLNSFKVSGKALFSDKF